MELEEIVELAELVLQDKVILVEIQMHLLEKEELEAVELERPVEQVEIQEERQVEQEVLRHHYHLVHSQVVAVEVQTVIQVQVVLVALVVEEQDQEDLEVALVDRVLQEQPTQVVVAVAVQVVVEQVVRVVQVELF